MTLFQGLGFWASSLSGAKPGMVLVKPTSISHSGTSATLGANGQVTFTAVTSLSINGVFTADFDNYIMHIATSVGGDNFGYLMRLRAAGSDASGSNYAYQLIDADNTSVSANRTTASTSFRINQMQTAARTAGTLMIYGPFLAQPTATRTTDVSAASGAYLIDIAGTHSLSTSYDGMTIFTSSAGSTGVLAVYGIRS
jgi:hypothetical protein